MGTKRFHISQVLREIASQQERIYQHIKWREERRGLDMDKTFEFSPGILKK